MADHEYYYAVTRVHAREGNLLNRENLNQLLDAKSLSDAFSILERKGWGSSELLPLDIDALIEHETEKTWLFISQLTGEIKPFNVFRHSRDGNNLKAAIKLEYANYSGDTSKFFMPFGTLPIDEIISSAKARDFSSLPAPFNTAGSDAFQALSHTHNGQNSDIIIDRAVLEKIHAVGLESDSVFLKHYVDMLVDVANIKIAVRSQSTGKNRDFIQRAMAPCGTLDTEKLISATMDSIDEIYKLLKDTQYKEAIPSLESSMESFEVWCDNVIIREMRPQRFAISGIEPLAAYIVARENEIKMVKLILSIKENQMDTHLVKERMREMYV